MAKRNTTQYLIETLKEQGVAWAMDEYNRDLVSAEMEQKVESLRKDIIDGKIKVHDYFSTSSCVY